MSDYQASKKMVSKIFIPLIIIVTLFSCKKEESTTPAPKLKNCAIEYLKFDNDHKCPGYNSVNFAPNGALKTVVSFEYKGDQIIKTIGGFKVIIPGGIFSLLFSMDVYDEIAYANNSIFVITKPEEINSYFSNYPGKPTIYTKDSDGRLIKIERRDGVMINYTYENNQIVEKLNTGKVLRNFTMENNNLTKITRENGDTSYLYYSKEEILFQDFDNRPNPLRNMYHVSGAFYRSFSKNNYSKYTVNYYERMENGRIGHTGTGTYSMPIQYNADGYPKFGEYEE